MNARRSRARYCPRSSFSALSGDDALKLWKGLFYCMYMADKPLLQEAVAEDISGLIHYINNEEDCRSFVQAGFLTFAREWNGIDVFRIDKYMMFIRRFLRHIFTHLRASGWKMKDVMAYTSILETVVVCPDDHLNTTALGLKTHVCEIILEELAKVGGESLKDSVVVTVIQPYFKVLALTKINVYARFVREGIIRHLIRQTLCAEEEEEGEADNTVLDTNATPEDDAESEEKMEEELESALDPRAGRVDTYIPQLKVDLSEWASSQVQTRNREVIYRLVCELRDAAQGYDPLALPNDHVENVEVPDSEVEKAVERLVKFEEDLSAGRKIEDDSDDDLKPVKKRVFKSKYQKKKYLRLKQKKKLGTKGLSKAKRRKLDARLKAQAVKRSVAVDHMVRRVAAAAGVPRSSLTKPAPDEQIKKSNGFEVSPISQKKKKVIISKTLINDFTVEVTPVGKKRRKNVETAKKASKKKCFDVSVIESPCNGKPETSIVKENGNAPSVINEGMAEKKNNKIPSKVQKAAPVPTCNGEASAVNGKPSKGKGLLDAQILLKKVNKKKMPPKLDKTAQNTNTKVADNNAPSKSKGMVINFSESKKQKGLGGVSSPKKSPWDEPLQKGEYEVFIKSKKQGRKTKEKKISSIKKRLTASLPGQRRISINLKKNKEHEFSDYVRTLRASPCIPFRADQAPKAPVLKPSPSPILVRGPLVRKRLQRMVAASASPQLSLKKYRQTAAEFF
ncbi:Ribosomal RNA processing protein 1 B [Chionoecetes opilio]|uniref:Ribosomal RNA processing protein 1 B n=1 Tax=Chionoecetes opilio TaxID=41210 RepID=A0A8J5CZ26_CHIOP|nr:Ribosomal RNA processing protein 1 B [Chionoecetes opilio]